MTAKIAFNTLDVFTGIPYSGNQLAIVHVPKKVPLSQTQKQKIAIEFNYSETVFLHEPVASAPATYHIDIFTPESEIPLAGHPTIGAAYHIFSTIEPESVNEITIVLKAGNVKATFDRDSLIAGAEIPHNVHLHAQKVDWKYAVAAQPGLSCSSRHDIEHDIFSVVEGLNFALIDLTYQPELLENVAATKENTFRAEQLDEAWPPTLLGNLFFVRNPDQNDGVIRVQQRMIFSGIEDPATGAASAALTSYLSLKDGQAGKRYRYELEQGTQMGRRSIILVDVTLNDTGKGVKTIALRGQCQDVMEGSLRIPM